MLLVEPLQQALEELLQSVVRVFSSIDHMLQQVLSEFLLAFSGVALIEYAD